MTSLSKRLSIVLGAVLLLGTFGATAGAQAPALLHQQGRLLNTDNTPVAGTIQMVFTLYTLPTAGTVLWTETHSVTLDEGYFSVTFGSTTAIDDTVFDGTPRYMGITVGADPEMTPRAELVSVPYALVATDATGDIHPRSVSVNGSEVINSVGQWVGDPTGLTGITQMVYSAGAGTTPTATLAFLSTTVQVTVVAGQKVLITATQSFGSTTGAGSLDIYPCFRLSASTATPTTVSLGIFDLTAAAGQRHSFTISGVATPVAAGTYDVGMCGGDSGNGQWNNNEWGYVSALVSN